MNDRLQNIQDFFDLINSYKYTVYREELNKLLEWAQKQVNDGGRDHYDENIGVMRGIQKCINIEKKLKHERDKIKGNKE
jgi:hypothetical protein